MKVLLISLFTLTGYFIWVTTLAPLPPALDEPSGDRASETSRPGE